MDVTAAAPAAAGFAEKFGFPALLVVMLLIGAYFLLKWQRDEREKRDDKESKERETRDDRDEKREEARRQERKEDREAHLGALGKHTEALTVLGAGFVRLEQKVDNLDRDVTDLKRVKVG